MKLYRSLIISSAAILLSLAIAQPALAQQSNKASKDDSGIGVGAEAMAVFPNVSNLQTGFDTKTGYGFGLWVGGNKNGLVGFTGEFIYKLTKIDSTTGLGTAKRHSLEIPAVFHINFGSRSKNGAIGYAVLGPVFTVNVKNTLTGGLAGNNFSSADVGALVGAGFEVARIAIEARANLGFKTVTNSGGGSFNDSKDRSVELLGKVRFN